MKPSHALAAALLAVSPAFAQNQQSGSTQDFGNRVRKATEASMANQFLSFPLPMNNLLKGKWQLGVDGGYSAVDAKLIEMKGGMLSVGYTYAFADKWGVYALAFGNSLSASGGGSDRLVHPWIRSGLPISTPAQAEFSNTRGTARNTGVGAALVWDPLVSGEESHSMPVYVGVIMSRYTLDDLKTDYRITSGADTGQRGIIDLTGDYSFMMPFIGWQYARNWGKFKIVPNALLAPPLTSVAQKGRITGTAPKVFDVSGDTESSGFNDANFDPSVVALGTTVIYRPWGLGANLGATLFKRLAGNTLHDGVESVFQFDLSWRFGNYVR